MEQCNDAVFDVGRLDSHISRAGPGSSEFVAVCHCGATRQQMRGVRDSHVASLSLINEETKVRDWPRAAREEASEPVRCDQWTTQRPGFRRVRAPRRQPSTFTRRIPPPRSHTGCHRHRIPAALVNPRHLSRREWHVSICNYDAWIHSMAQQITGIRARADVVGRRANLGGTPLSGGGRSMALGRCGSAAVQQPPPIPAVACDALAV